MIFNEFNLQKIEQTLESNLNILKNTNPGAYERYLKEYGGDPQKLISERMDYVRENPETIKILHGNLDNYNNALKKSEKDFSKDFSSALTKNDKMKENMTNFFEKLSKLKHKDPSDPEVQKLVSEFRKYSKTVYSEKDIEVMLQRAKLIQGNLESNPALKKELEKISEKHRKYYDDIYGQGFFDFWDKSIEYSKKVNK